MGHSEGSPEREVSSNTDLPAKDREIANKQPNPITTRTGGTTTKQPRASRRKEIIKIRAQLNNIKIKKQFRESMNTGAHSLKRETN